jgi:hypothetical protein
VYLTARRLVWRDAWIWRASIAVLRKEPQPRPRQSPRSSPVFLHARSSCQLAITPNWHGLSQCLGKPPSRSRDSRIVGLSRARARRSGSIVAPDVMTSRRGWEAQAPGCGCCLGNEIGAYLILPPRRHHPLHPITAVPSQPYHCNHEGNHIPRHGHRGWHRLRRRAQDAAEEGPIVQAAGKLRRVTHQNTGNH